MFAERSTSRPDWYGNGPFSQIIGLERAACKESHDEPGRRGTSRRLTEAFVRSNLTSSGPQQMNARTAASSRAVFSNVKPSSNLCVAL